MAYDPRDYYFKKAKKDQFAARSVYKLEEIDERFKLLKEGGRILDLGAAPGSWSQYASKKVGLRGRVLGIDLQQVRLTLPNAVFLQADILSMDLEMAMRDAGLEPPFDSVLSDMAPKTTGIRITDQERSLELCRMALGCATKYLKEGGNFVCKLFHGSGFEELRSEMRALFGTVEVLRPKSTRKESKEVFLIGKRFNGKRLEKADS